MRDLISKCIMKSTICSHKDRNKWLTCEDNELLKECTFTEFQSSGPGGQKRNRKYSSVRLFHQVSGIEVTAVKSRSQNTNKHLALRKLRCRIAMHVRCSVTLSVETLNISLRNSQYPCLLAVLFDTMHRCGFKVSDASKLLEISTGKLVKLLARDSDAWQVINSERKQLGLSILKTH